MVGKYDTSTESTDLSKKIATLAKKAKLKSELDIITTLQAFEVSKSPSHFQDDGTKII